MYFGHLGLSEQPFAHTATSDSFYEGGGRGATLDALIYVLTHGEGIEGIIKLTGESGSGKTALCQVLMKRLPAGMKTFYLDRQNMSRDELFHSVARELKFELAESAMIEARTIVAMCDLQNALIEKYADGKQVVLLVDEAHTLPVETLEALRLLYELESSHHKLLQIILFGRPELEHTLALPPMRQLKDRITHHLVMQPFNDKAVSDYLMFRMRAAGYRGPDIFNSEAVRLITMASGGLIHQINLLADKSLLAAYAAHDRDIDAHHVRTAINDLGIKRHHPPNRRIASVGAMFAVVGLGVLGWQALDFTPTNVTPTAASVSIEAATSAPFSAPISPPAVVPTAPSVSSAASAPASRSAVPPVLPELPPSTASVPPKSSVPPEPPAKGTVASTQDGLTATPPAAAKLDFGGIKLAGHKLLEQRITATKDMMATMDKNYYSIQLFETQNVQPDRMERFLTRAQSLVNLSDLYIHLVTNNGQAKFRVTYGIYSSRDRASVAETELPQKYRTDFQTELYTMNELR
ncbi:AAA family ATPase [Nitrosospira sp. NpAV]|uniref:AAA family ATPase n=1 Tax=Nitrosospira sp. NpAV TaxID=58133 RepID=UPI000698520D|nr:AAA family ATPase [Nitrosospira sp. NpAV]